MKRCTLLLFCLGFAAALFAQQFPAISAVNLNERKVDLPNKGTGRKSVIVLALSAGAEKQLKEWSQPLYNALMADAMGGMMGGSIYNADVFFVVMANGLAKMALPDIMEKSKKGITDKRLYEVMLYSENDVDAVMKGASITDKREPHFFVVDSNGIIEYHTSGSYSDKKLDELTGKLLN